MDRITIKTLRARVDYLNRETNSPMEPYTFDPETGRSKANIGNYHISQAYGGYSLHRMHNEGGGVEDVFRCGHTTARDLYNRIRAFEDGIYTAKQED